MQSVSNTYKSIVAGAYETKTKLVIAGVEYGEDKLFSVSTSHSLFNGRTPAVGGCVSGELQCVVIAGDADIPRMAEIKPYVQVYNELGKQSEWILKGIYYADTREVSPRNGTVTIHAYDMMMAMEAKYEETSSMTDYLAVQKVCSKIGVSLDANTSLGKNYTVKKPDTPTSMRTIMGNIAAAYAGNWIITDLGELKLIKLNTLPKETFYLIDKTGEVIKYGGDRVVIG